MKIFINWYIEIQSLGYTIDVKQENNYKLVFKKFEEGD